MYALVRLAVSFILPGIKTLVLLKAIMKTLATCHIKHEICRKMNG